MWLLKYHVDNLKRSVVLTSDDYDNYWFLKVIIFSREKLEEEVWGKKQGLKRIVKSCLIWKERWFHKNFVLKKTCLGVTRSINLPTHADKILRWRIVTHRCEGARRVYFTTSECHAVAHLDKIILRCDNTMLRAVICGQQHEFLWQHHFCITQHVLFYITAGIRNNSRFLFGVHNIMVL